MYLNNRKWRICEMGNEDEIIAINMRHIEICHISWKNGLQPILSYFIDFILAELQNSNFILSSLVWSKFDVTKFIIFARKQALCLGGSVTGYIVV